MVLHPSFHTFARLGMAIPDGHDGLPCTLIATFLRTGPCAINSSSRSATARVTVGDGC